MSTTHQTRTQRRLIDALPSLCDVKRGALLWSFAMTASCSLALWYIFRGAQGRGAELVAIFFVGSLIAWPFALFLARLVGLGAGPLWRFASAFLALSGTTVLATAFIFTQQYRSFYAQWHAPAFSQMWFREFLETSASAAYQFAVLGVRLYFPLGLLALIITSLWLARRMR